MTLLAAIWVGFVLDLMLGDPEGLYHPVRAMGWYIVKGEALLRPLCRGRAATLLWGGVLSLSLVALSFLLPFALLRGLALLHPALAFVAQAFLSYQVLATRSLYDESMKVYRALVANDVPAARWFVSRIVGRDTDVLDRRGIAKAAVETVAENLSDGVIAPLLFLMIGGAPLALAYKAVSTLDSMIGYYNERYLYFGRIGARLDDAANLIPARLTALIMMLSTPLLRLSLRGAVHSYLRDRYKHKSPNSAHPESVCAGALGIQLGGGAFYGGVWMDKPGIGLALRPVEAEDIRRANRLMMLTTTLSLVLFSAARALILYL